MQRLLWHRKFTGLDFPLITLERSIDQATSGIECDNYQGGVLATELLIERVAKNLCILAEEVPVIVLLCQAIIEKWALKIHVRSIM